MSKYFKSFPSVSYRFGDNESPVSFKNLSVFVDILDNIKDRVSVFQTYDILDGERPDTVSYKLYGTTQYHWTFLLMNDHLRTGGWPLDNEQIYNKIYESYPYYAVQATNRGNENEKLNDALNDNNIGSTFTVGTVVRGSESGVTGTIKSRNIDIGQFIIDTNTADGFKSDVTNINYDVTDPETKIPNIQYTSPDGNTQYLRILSQTKEYNGVHHYEDSDGNWVDIDSYDLIDSDGTGSVWFKYRYQPKVTFLENLISRNDELKKIVVIKPQSIETIVSELKRAISG